MMCKPAVGKYLLPWVVNEGRMGSKCESQGNGSRLLSLVISLLWDPQFPHCEVKGSDEIIINILSILMQYDSKREEGEEGRFTFNVRG